jgi:hypothetical protein
MAMVTAHHAAQQDQHRYIAISLSGFPTWEDEIAAADLPPSVQHRHLSAMRERQSCPPIARVSLGNGETPHKHQRQARNLWLGAPSNVRSQDFSFWKFKHDIRWTGMPSWKGTLTDQQIWTLALFL